MGGIFKWPTKMGETLDVILVNQVGYLSGPLKWLKFSTELNMVCMWPTQMGRILGALLVNWVEYLYSPINRVRFWVQCCGIRWGIEVAH